MNCGMHFEFDVRSLASSWFHFLGGRGEIRYAKLQMRNLNFTRSLFLTLFKSAFKKYIKKVIKELKPKSVPKSKKYVGLPVIL